MYADSKEAEKDKSKHLFNCAQRAHQNTLENYPTFLVLFSIASIQYPLISTAAGLVWLLGRYVYANGYCTGDPAKRNRGAFAYLGLFTLLGASIKTAFALATAV